jgi:hypothetical protein
VATDNSKDPTPPADPPKERTPEEVEAAYWEKLTGHLDSWFDAKVEKYRGTSPTRMGRTTLPGILADIVFGPPKDGK